MYPTLIKIGSFSITSFGLMMFLSFVVGAWTLSEQLHRRGYDRNIAWDALAWIAVGGILGAKIYYILLHLGDLQRDPVGELTSRGGLVWYGGFIGGVLAYYLQVKRWKLPIPVMFDAVAAPLMIAYAVGRIGCFLVGDDYGLPTNSRFGIAFPQGAPPTTAGYLRSVGGVIPASVPDWAIVKVWPTQIFEVIAATILFGVLWQLSSRKLRPGQLFGAYLFLYGIERFLIEILRAKSDRVLMGMSTSQLVSIFMVGLGVYLWQRKTAAAVSPSSRATQRKGASGQPAPAGHGRANARES
jgi:phosphatidylglycerol---prolipoprotein diacylglyceryl transferase